MVEQNEILAKLPQHLLQFVNDQHYELYSPIDQAVWRYVMQKNIQFLPSVAHHSYLEGLKKTGISIEKIPNMYGMNRILKEIGWAAVAVDGYIPTAAFLEFQAYNVLVIAHNIRQAKHLEYTPAPDIIHEAAGHAPIIANPEYAEYLRRLGEIGCRAISSQKEQELYKAVRHLAIVKEAPNSSNNTINEAQEKVDLVQNNMGKASEMSKIKNLHWWTVEYGLIGTLENPKIYGAGLLSSIGESKSCLKKSVEKRWYDISATDQNFDITKPQPQLFVTPDFAHLSFVLEQFANKMALRLGGANGIKQLIQSKQMGTAEYNTGLQISGKFSELIVDEYNRPIYLKTEVETALAYQQKELIGHGIAYHRQGFGSPIGKLKNINTSIENMSPYDLMAYKIREGEQVSLAFEGGIIVEGEVITGKRTIKGTIILISFKNCTVKHYEKILFRPEWGVYDMAVGTTIISAYAGAADYDSFDLVTYIKTDLEPVQQKSKELIQLEKLYAEVKEMRDSSKIKKERLNIILNDLQENYPEDFLLTTGINELLVKYITFI